MSRRRTWDGRAAGVLTETTAEMAVALTLAAARRLGEAEQFIQAGRYQGWLPALFLGERLVQKTVGVIGLWRISSAYARMMAEGFEMNLIYYDLKDDEALEEFMSRYAAF